MIVLLFLLVNAISSITGANFSNPLMPYIFTPTPSVLQQNKLYYAISGNYDKGSKRLSIHASTDLQNWELSAYVFDDDSWPGWIKDKSIFDPEIQNFTDNNFVMYFQALNAATMKPAIGAAYSRNLLGPYYAFSHPIRSDTVMPSYTPHVFNDSGTLYMFWTNQSWIFAASMNNDGLSFKNSEVHFLIEQSDDWEISLLSPFMIKRKNYYYLFYSGFGPCGSVTRPSGIGVARSKHPYGPYEKFYNNPILPSYAGWNGIHSPSIVLDTDRVTYVLMYEAEKEGTVCSERLLCAQTIKWDIADWPVISGY